MQLVYNINNFIHNNLCMFLHTCRAKAEGHLPCLLNRIGLHAVP
jgi:hypothetical protein